ncbi:hypothetical protein EU508_08520 [Pseudoalteromonas fuliginea]|uniref:Lipoprotein n=1 Tax=Pseudoalteromonas fuliginea TaxID=1872678 RepID=A0AB73BHZ0_9GAMM|nr:hypothetical protein EU508_08520 [Pseudoalteromonas fuliginea]
MYIRRYFFMTLVSSLTFCKNNQVKSYSLRKRKDLIQ